MEEITHSYLIERAKCWLKNTKRCGITICELVTYVASRPDVLGFRHDISIQIECKTSHSDFLRDKKKFVREVFDQSSAIKSGYLLARAKELLEG